jgi:hypothetical protein
MVGKTDNDKQKKMERNKHRERRDTQEEKCKENKNKI